MTNSGSFNLAVIFHEEDGCWWAESTDLRGWTAAADTREDLIETVTESLKTVKPCAHWFWYTAPVES